MIASQADVPARCFSDGNEFMYKQGRNQNVIGLTYLVGSPNLAALWGTKIFFLRKSVVDISPLKLVP